MRKLPMLALLACIILGASVPRAARAEDVRINKLVTLSVGYKLWLSNWETSIGTYQGQDHVTALVAPTKGASIPNMSLKVWKFLLTGSYMAPTKYNFPGYRDTYASGGVQFTSWETIFLAKRSEYDVNAGFFITPNIVTTVGWKEIKQQYTEYNKGRWWSESTTKYKGPTIGLAGGAGIGYGFSLYGSAAYGYMKTWYSGSNERPIAIYEAMETGLAWRWKIISASLGYKFQYLTTRGSIDSADVTRGYMLGFNLNF